MSMFASQPQTIGKVLDDGFKFYTRTLLQILPLSFLAVVIPVVIIVLFVGGQTYLQIASGKLDPATTDITAILASFGIGGVIAMALAVLFYAAIFYKMGAAAQGQAMSIGGSLTLAAKAAIPLLIAAILYSLAVTLGFVLLIIPGIILMVSLILYMPAYTMDNAGIIGCLTKSHNLVWGNWWRTLLIFSIPAVILMVIYVGIGTVYGILIAVTAEKGNLMQYQILLEVAQYTVNVFLTPLFPAFMIILYNDLKLRKEGSDLDAKISGAA